MEEIQPRPKKPPDTGCIILERINPGVLRPTGGFENILRFDKNVDSGDDVQVPDDRRVAEKVTEGADTITVPINDGDSIHEQTPIDEEGGAAKADVDTDDDGEVMDKHVDKGGIVWNLVAEDGDVCTQLPLDE